MDFTAGNSSSNSTWGEDLVFPEIVSNVSGRRMELDCCTNNRLHCYLWLYILLFNSIILQKIHG
ncbi:hypothetical protein OESDEN_14271 [Oesophagostomum dentatum]|uniref:Uncharacterized protein n=1 Tax=Oesophagostomum dentatum TaxID=61180 RepID=A0A0B1SQ21_OESDE|nr:hypothetical protein OESDEN_14271 [Oesophagostomum dentatum]